MVRILLKLTMADEKLAKLKTLFKNLQTDAKSVLFTEEKINEEPLEKLKKSKHDRDITFVNLFVGNVNINDDEKKSTPTKMAFAEKKDDGDGSIFYRFVGLFQLLHVEVGNLEFWGKISN